MRTDPQARLSAAPSKASIPVLGFGRWDPPFAYTHDKLTEGLTKETLKTECTAAKFWLHIVDTIGGGGSDKREGNFRSQERRAPFLEIDGRIQFAV